MSKTVINTISLEIPVVHTLVADTNFWMSCKLLITVTGSSHHNFFCPHPNVFITKLSSPSPGSYQQIVHVRRAKFVYICFEIGVMGKNFAYA